MGILDRLFPRRKPKIRRERWESSREASPLTPDLVRHYLRQSSILQGVYQSIMTAGNAFEYRTLGDDGAALYETAVDAYGGQYLADWIVVGEVRLNDYLIPDAEGDIVALNTRCPSFAARTLFETLLLTENAEYEFASRLGATIFITPSYDGNKVVIGSAEEIEGLRQLFHDKRRAAGVGGVEPLTFPVQFVAMPLDAKAYDLDGLYKRAIRKVCSLYGIDSTLLNDPDNKTYASKEAALKAFYTHTLIPETYRMLARLNTAIALAGKRLQVHVDTSTALPAQDFIGERVGWVSQLLDRGVIDKTEARKLLGI